MIEQELPTVQQGPRQVFKKLAAQIRIVVDSLLIQTTKDTHDDLRMPSKVPLQKSVVSEFECWVENGAVRPHGLRSPPAGPALPGTKTGDQDWCSARFGGHFDTGNFGAWGRDRLHAR